MISATLDGEGAILHLNDHAGLIFGELDGEKTPRMEAIRRLFDGAGFDAQASRVHPAGNVGKVDFHRRAGGITSLMRAAVGDIVAADAGDRARAFSRNAR